MVRSVVSVDPPRRQRRVFRPCRRRPTMVFTPYVYGLFGVCWRCGRAFALQSRCVFFPIVTIVNCDKLEIGLGRAPPHFLPLRFLQFSGPDFRLWVLLGRVPKQRTKLRIIIYYFSTFVCCLFDDNKEPESGCTYDHNLLRSMTRFKNLKH